MKTIDQKIEFLIEEKKINKNELAKAIGVSPGAVSNWTAGLSMPKANSSIKLAEYFGVTLESLTEPSLKLKFKQKMVTIPYYREVSASAGNGLEALDETAEDLCIQEKFISNPNNTIALRISGDSMEPIFVDGTIIFVDISNRNVVDGKVYVFVHDGMVRMKELEVVPKGFRLKSYNLNYKTESVDTEYEVIKIIGKVIGQLQMY